MQRVVAEIGAKIDELEQLEKDLSEWQTRKETGKAGVLTFTVRSVKTQNGQDLDPSNIRIQVDVDGESPEKTVGEGEQASSTDVFGLESTKGVTETFKIDLTSLDINLKVTCHNNSFKEAVDEKENSAEKVSDEDGVLVEGEKEEDETDSVSNLNAQPSVKSVPYVAIFDVNGTPSDTTERRDIEAVCTETGDSIILSVNALFDDCDSAITSTTSKAQQVKVIIEQLEDALKSGANSQQSPAAANADDGAAGSEVASPQKKKQKKTKAGKAPGISLAQSGQVAVALLLEYRSYWLFGSAALAIYCFGDNASV